MAQQRCIIKNTGAPQELADVELCDLDPKTGAYVPNGTELKVPSLLYFQAGKAGVVNDFTPDPATGLPAGKWLCAVE
jgi:hypothetical protein